MTQTTIIEPFNSPLEAGLRSTAILEAAYPERYDLQRLVQLDYLVVHSADTGVDDSAVVQAVGTVPDTSRQILLIDELMTELTNEIEENASDFEELQDQLKRLETTISGQKSSLEEVQSELGEKVNARRAAFKNTTEIENRINEINELIARFELLEQHYLVDKERLEAIQESGSLFVHLPAKPCPLCGAPPDDYHKGQDCNGDVEAIISAAGAEIEKIDMLLTELKETVSDLDNEKQEISIDLQSARGLFQQLDEEIKATISPQVAEARNKFSEVIEKRSKIHLALDKHHRLERLETKRQALIEDEPEDETDKKTQLEVGLASSTAHALSMRIERVLKAWNFPGECRVHFDKDKNDFIIDGKPRGSRGKGLRAISHAAITIALLEYCQEQSLPHPGFVIMDSPLLAYFKPEGEEDMKLQGSDLKERFYKYLIEQHNRDSQIIIIENEHPPEKFVENINMTVFTRNPNEGRYGLL